MAEKKRKNNLGYLKFLLSDQQIFSNNFYQQVSLTSDD